MNLRECSDGSFTLFNEEVGECYHSPMGAALEAREKFVGAIDWLSYVQKGHVRILDLCFGMGYNTAAALEVFSERFPTCQVEIIGLELDPGIVVQSLAVPNPFSSWPLVERLIRARDGSGASLREGSVTLSLIMGDARRTVHQIGPCVDVVFFDPFSPKKDPALWQEDFVRLVYEVCCPGGSVVTYSCARQVRETFRSVGFAVHDGPVVGRRGPATLFTKDS